MDWSKLILAPLLLCFCNQVRAQESAEAGLGRSEPVAVYGNACEKINSSEPRSSTRVRVTDMASYAAAENIPEISKYRKQLNDHDFSILVYNLVDNYLEDLSVKTLVEDGREMCVEVKGIVRPENLQTAWEETERELRHREEIAQMEALAHPNPQELYPDVNAPQPQILVKPDGAEGIPPAKIYFEPTRFYNNTRSNNFAKVLKQFFKNKPNIEITEDQSEADYTIYSEVLRAKVDPINDNNNRLQMVISLDLRNAENRSLIMEHQNRFVLFTSDENEQEVAFRLLKKLFNNAAQLLYKKIERDSDRGKVSKVRERELITPNP